MSNQLQTQAETLASILAANRLTKVAEQEISHKDLLDQHNLGKEQTNEIHENIAGVNADTRAARNTSRAYVQSVVGAQDLNKPAEQALAATGTSVNTITPDECPTGTPAQQAKSAAHYRAELANIMGAMYKKASEHVAEREAAEGFRTGTEVMAKFASLDEKSTAADLADAREDLIKLAAYNPVFNICRERIMMEKMAADVAELAAAEGISPEEAAAELDAAAAENPDMVADLEDEVAGEAVADLAQAEEETGALMEGIDQLAANASANLGVEVTPDDIVDAAEEVEAMAEQMGVPPEALIQEAMDQMQAGGEAGMPEVTPEDEANAQMILDEAAKNGISPEEVIQMAAEELEGGAGAMPEEPIAEEPMTEKAASLQKRAGTMRAQFVQALRRYRG